MEASTSFIVHPCRYYIGNSLGKSFGKRNEPVTFDLVVAAIDGTIVADIPYTVSISGEGSERVEDAKGMTEWKKVKDDRVVQGKSEKGEFKFAFTPTIGGQYRYPIFLLLPLSFPRSHWIGVMFVSIVLSLRLMMAMVVNIVPHVLSMYQVVSLRSKHKRLIVYQVNNWK
jgi:hypothetical protein